MTSQVDPQMDQSSFTEAEQKEWTSLCATKQFLLTRVNEEKAKIIPKKTDTIVNMCKRTIDSKTSAIAAREQQIITLQEEIKRYKQIIEQQEIALREREEYLKTPRSPALAAAEEKLRLHQEKMNKFIGVQTGVPPTAPEPPPEPKKVNPLNGGDSDSESEDFSSEEEENQPPITQPPSTAPPPGPPPAPTKRVIRGKGRKDVEEESDSEEDRATAMRAFFSPDSFRAAPRHFAPQMDVDRPRVIQNTKKQPKRVVAY